MRRNSLTLTLALALMIVPAAAWAGGWYLMVPPGDPETAGSPDASWSSLGSYDTASHCQHWRAESLKKIKTQTREAEGAAEGNPQALAAMRVLTMDAVARMKAALCVASDDARLARTSPGARPGLLDEALGELATTVIPFTPGQAIYVDAHINGQTWARLVLDTGADSTILAPRVLEAAGVHRGTRRGTTTLRGVTGQATVEVYDLASLRVGQARVGPLKILAYDRNDPKSDGLLGRDFLDQFTITINNAAGRVTLSQKSKLGAVPPSAATKPAPTAAGWYLLSPPYTDDGGVRAEAALTSWNVVASFDTAASCEREREDRRQFALGMLDLPPLTAPTLDNVIRSDREAKLRAQCIRARDPRLMQRVAVPSQPSPPPAASPAPPSSMGSSAPPPPRGIVPLPPELAVQVRSQLSVRAVLDRAQWHHDPPVGDAVVASDVATCKDETWRAFREAWRPFREGGGKDVAGAEALAPVVVRRATDELRRCMQGRGYTSAPGGVR
jgi:predicted aspartyl protease